MKYLTSVVLEQPCLFHPSAQTSETSGCQIRVLKKDTQLIFNKEIDHCSPHLRVFSQWCRGKDVATSSGVSGEEDAKGFFGRRLQSRLRAGQELGRLCSQDYLPWGPGNLSTSIGRGD